MDYFTIIAQCAVLDRELAGRKIEIVRFRGHRDLFLGFEGDDALKLACIPDMPYLHLMEKRFIPRRDAQDWHLARFAGKRLSGITVTPGDRVLSFAVDSGDRIVFELTGRNANLLVLNPGGTILGAARPVAGREGGYRVIRPGVAYVPPPPRDVPDLASASVETLVTALEGRGEQLLFPALTSVAGGSRLFAAEVMALAEIAPDVPAAALSPEEKVRLMDAAAALARVVAAGGEGGTVVMDAREDIPRDVFPLPMAGAGGHGRHFEDMNEAVAVYAREREIALERKSLRQTVISALAREERAVRATMGKVEHDRGGESEPERLEQGADALLASLHLVTRGMPSVALPDPRGGEITVELDPALDGAGNAARLYTRARKLRAASRLAGERLASLERRIAEIGAERERLDSLETIRALREMAARYARWTGVAHEPGAEEKFPRRFVSVSGLEIIVGRNDEENDDLVRWARRDDIWLHAQGVGGSHVVLRAANRQMPDHRSVGQAASIAAYYSKAKTSAIVPVVWTPVKYVVKRKGQGPGQVTYTHEKVVFVEPLNLVRG